MWQSKECITQCGKPGIFPDVSITLDAFAKACSLCDAMSNLEWIGWCLGTISDELVLVDDIVIPRQVKPSSGWCEMLPGEVSPERKVGVIHSHHNMGTFHSPADQSYVDANNPVSLIITNSGAISASVKGKTLCGAVMVKEITVHVHDWPDHTKWAEETKTFLLSMPDKADTWGGKGTLTQVFTTAPVTVKADPLPETNVSKAPLVDEYPLEAHYNYNGPATSGSLRDTLDKSIAKRLINLLRTDAPLSPSDKQDAIYLLVDYVYVNEV